MEVSKYNQMMAHLTRPRERFDKGGMAKLVEYAKNLPKNTILTRNMVEDYVKKNKLNVNIENFFNRKAPNIKGLKVDTSFQFTDIEKNRIEKFGKSKYDKLGPEQRYQVRKGVDVGALAPEKQQKVKFKKAYSDAEKFYKSAGIKIDDSIKEIIRKNIANNKGKFVPPGKGAKAFRGNVMKVLRDVFVNNPDANSIDIAKAIYGDKKFNAASLIKKEKMIQDARSQVPKFIRLFSPGSKEIIKGFKDIKPEVLADILESVESRIGDFGFDSGTRRELQFAIADAEKGLPERATVEARKKILTKGKAVDETIGVSSTFKNASGYIEATQVIDPKINTLKGKTIDRDFKSAFEKAMKGDYSEVKNYNKKAIAFQNKYNVDTPIIRTGENLDPKKFVSEFENYSPGAQKNINQIAKDKGIVIQTKSKPLFSFSELGGDTAKYLAALGCPGKAMGGRIEFQVGGAPTQECIARGAEKINNPSLIKGGAEARNASQFLNRAYKLGRNVVKFGVIPEAIFVAGESLVRMGLGDTLGESLLRATDYLLPGNQTRKADQLKFDRTLDKETSDIILKAQDYKKSIEQLNTAKSNLKTNQAVIDGSDFSYTGNVDALERQKLDQQIIKLAEQNVKNKYVPEAVRAFATVKEAEAQDIADSNSVFAKAIQNAKSAEVDDFETLFTPEKKQEGVAPPMFTMDDIANIAVTDTQLQRAKDELGGAPEYTKRNILDFKRQTNKAYNDAVLSLIFAEGEKNLANRERLFGTQSLFGGAPIIDTPNRGQSSYIQSPFQREEENRLIEEGARFGAAGGGIMKLAGIDKGPQITSMNPDSGGLDSLRKNVKKL